MNQLAFSFSKRAIRARSADPDTSIAAAERVQEFDGEHYRLIINALVVCGPMGKDGIAHVCDLTGVQVARRLSELHDGGKVEPTGRTCQSNTGRQEREWRLV